MKKIYLLHLMLITFALSTAAGTPIYDGEPSSTYFRSWLLCGPFPNPQETYEKLDRNQSGFYIDYLKNHGGEINPRIDDDWIEYESDSNAIYLDQAVSQDPFVLAYAYCEIQSSSERPCILALGSNDGARVWLNGEEILDLPVSRGLRLDDDTIPVVLRKGRNTLLLKIAETENIWAFSCRLLPYDKKYLNKDQTLFRVINDKEGNATLRFTGSEALIGKIVKEAQIEAFSTRDLDMPIWKKKWTGTKEIPIEIESNTYGEYNLQLTVTMIDSTEHQLSIPFSIGRRIDYTLFQNGATDYSIIIGEDAPESEQWAVKELQRWLKEISGAEFPIRNDSTPRQSKEIIVGFNSHTKEILGNETTAPADMDESFQYFNTGASIVIYGGCLRGTIYGVMSFLENEFGCRWYTPSVSVIPKRDSYSYHDLHHTESPGIRVRNDFYYEAFEPIWAARNRVNGAMNYREQPGGLECYWAVHTFYPLMPPSEFFDEHPEYYSLIDGKRVHNRAQLCLTNPDVLRIITERIKKRMRESPEYLIYSVSQNDWANPCQCPRCQAIAKREESESGPVIWFVNQVAEAVEKEFPDKFIGTLAYQYTRKPCKTLRPRKNVVIRLCSIECCFAHDFIHCPENESFVKDIQGWAAIAPHLYIWDYVVNFSHYVMPYPNFRVLQPNLQFFRKYNAIGIMEQAAYQSRGGEFAELRMYLLAKLLWNPDCDTEAVIDDFMYGYYGRSGQYIRQYFDLLHNQLTPDTHIHLGLQPDDPLFSEEFIHQADLIFDKAEIVANNEDIKKRVEVARLPLLYLKCKRFPNESIRDLTYKKFTEITQREGITHYAESGKTHREAFHAEMKRAAQE